jgi:hypothetical protein
MGNAMSQENDIKIRVLPRKEEKQAPQPTPAPEAQDPSHGIYSAAAIACFAFAFVIIAPKMKASSAKKPNAPAVQQTRKMDLSSTAAASDVEALIDKNMQDTKLRQQMMIRSAEIENQQTRGSGDLDQGIVYNDSDRILGVQLDQDQSTERVLADVNSTNSAATEMTPADRINFKLANRQWNNDLDRAEKINYIRNFIRSAYERGYEVTIDQNLVVVGVKPINPNHKVNIDQVIDRLSKGF